MLADLEAVATSVRLEKKPAAPSKCGAQNNKDVAVILSRISLENE
jgi:hypothetical protein